MRTSLHENIENRFPEITDEGKEQLVFVSLGYLLKVHSSNELSKMIRQNCPGQKVIPYRHSLHNNGYFLKNIKLWLWRAVAKKYTRQQAMKKARIFQIKKKDVQLLEYLYDTSNILWETLENLSVQYKSHNLPFYEAALKEAVTLVQPYVQTFVYRKMRFLTWNSHLDFDDLIQELLHQGFIGIQRQYPKVESKLHLLNIFKRCVHNHGINIIKYYTTKSRANMVKEDDGSFISIKASINASELDNTVWTLRNQTTDIAGTLLNNISDYTQIDHANLIERASIKTVSPGGKYNNQIKKAVRIITGKKDPKFSKYLNKDHNELQTYMIVNGKSDEYLDILADYLSIGGKKQKSKFIQQLENTLTRVMPIQE